MLRKRIAPKNGRSVLPREEKDFHSKSRRQRLYEFIEPGLGSWNWYDSFMLAVICVSLLPLFFKGFVPALRGVDKAAGAIFLVDYLLRFITADLKQKRPLAAALLHYPFTPMAVADLLSLLPSFMLSASSAFRVLRLFRLIRILNLFRLVKLSRYMTGFYVISAVLRRQALPLLSVFALTCAYIFLCAVLLFNLEPETFANFADALYWAAISVTSVGYGDICPVTAAGKAVAALSAVVGIAVIALPAGVITAGYLEVIRDRKKKEER